LVTSLWQENFLLFLFEAIQMIAQPEHVHPLKLVVILEQDNGDVVHIQVLIVVLIMLIVVQMGTNVMLPKVNVSKELKNMPSDVLWSLLLNTK